MNKFGDSVCDVSFLAGVAAMTAIISLTMADLVARIIGAPFDWVADLSSYLLCFSISASMPKVTRQGTQIAVTLLVEILKGRSRHILSAAVELVSSITCFAICALCIQVLIQQYHSGVGTVAVLVVEKWILSAILGYGFFLSGAMHFLNILETSRSLEPNNIGVD